MKRNTTNKLILAAFFASLTCVMTLVVTIPNTLGGYVNLGDGFVILSGWMLGPFFGFLAAGIGSSLADIISSYVIYAPATFLIKGLTALTAYCVFNALVKRFGAGRHRDDALSSSAYGKADENNREIKFTRMTGANGIALRLVSALSAECVMILGYFLYSSILYGSIAAAASIPGDLIQSACGIFLSILLYGIINRTRFLRHFLYSI